MTAVETSLAETALAGEFWNVGTINGQRVQEVLCRTERGMWVRFANGERWLVPWRDDQEAVRVRLSLVKKPRSE